MKQDITIPNWKLMTTTSTSTRRTSLQQLQKWLKTIFNTISCTLDGTWVKPWTKPPRKMIISSSTEQSDIYILQCSYPICSNSEIINQMNLISCFLMKYLD